MENNTQENLMKELEAFHKEKEKINKIIGRIGGRDNIQNKRVNILLISMIIVLLFMGGVLRRISLDVSVYCAILLGIVKIIWLIYEMKKTNHFQYWILNSIEIKVNEMNTKIKNIEKKLEELESKKESPLE
ncbi:hypothetical protein [Fusobacterium perfoetens]|uniref:hypothetical protein n=1 Tax=Fusobacterium perfoetens TaxID=852 RepID=UPI0004896D4E|nr:hypothetical protein [Fusobacterium perfoetens]MCI6152988.1 hypothetical protein [Fusobacterium perfoetens]MDY3237385.1 hypothetical protein [Fusobacterium perfoetens]